MFGDLEDEDDIFSAKPSKPAEKTETKPANPVEASKPTSTEKTQTTKPAETIPPEIKPAEAKPTETKLPEVKPPEVKPAETKPAESKQSKPATKTTLDLSLDRSPPPPPDDDDDDDDPFGGLASAGKGSAKKPISLVDDLAINDVDIFDEDIFSIKPKPKAASVTTKGAGGNKEDSIFDDPLNLFNK